MKIATAVRRLIKATSLGTEAQVLASQAVMLAKHLDDGEIPAYATPAAHRELRALVEQIGGAPGAEAGVTDAELDELLRGGAR
ncbi:MAG: hypothetical protein JJT89_00500 [Nitriliruptoraceae bacterium]|nr:hypothetical protein [Nitriliruptoraceae bacterium]